MQISRKHHVRKAEAKARIDAFLDELLRRELPGGVTIKDPSKGWVGDQLQFSFKAKKGFFGANISGVANVRENEVGLDFDVPGIVTAFVSEERIRETIDQQLAVMFPE